MPRSLHRGLRLALGQSSSLQDSLPPAALAPCCCPWPQEGSAWASSGGCDGVWEHGVSQVSAQKEKQNNVVGLSSTGEESGECSFRLYFLEVPSGSKSLNGKKKALLYSAKLYFTCSSIKVM